MLQVFMPLKSLSRVLTEAREINKLVRLTIIMVFVAALSACSLSQSNDPPPKKPEDICLIFEEKTEWHTAAQEMQKRWGTPIYVAMAMMYQESSFRQYARPPKRYALGFIPMGRASSAYGFSQVKDETWADYQHETSSPFASRTNFADAIDFMGWFTKKTQKLNGVALSDTYNQYLNYHEGWGGFRKGSYKAKAWLPPVARKVEARGLRYSNQYAQCEASLVKEKDNDSWW